MTTINKVLVKVDNIRPNAIPADMKGAWVAELDGRINDKIVKKDEYTALTYPANGDDDLLADAPYESVYELYVLSMIDLTMQDYNNYNVTAKQYNDVYDAFSSSYIRNNTQSSSTSIKNLWG